MGNEDDQYWNKYKISRGNKEYIKEIRNPIKQLKREIYLLKEYLKYYGVDLWIEGYVLFVNMNSPVESEYTVNDKRRRQIAKTIPCLPIESNNAGSAFPSD